MRKKGICLLAAGLLAGCTTADVTSAVSYVDDDYRNTYEIFVYSFNDTNGDGIGDLNGVREKLDYIQDTGFNAIWLMPICPSPTYHKYDVTDYCSIDPAYGTMEDFDLLCKECHKRNIRVMTDLVLNHTSSQHPWFVDALQKKEASPYFDYYNFSYEYHDGYTERNGIYYECRFWEEMPDLNLVNEDVRQEIQKIMSFWIEHGVDGFRLDAVTSFYTGNDEQNIAFLKWLCDTGRSIKEDLVFVGEAWTQQSKYAAYYKSGINSLFDFAFSNFNGIIHDTIMGSYGADDYVAALVKEEELYASYNKDYVNAPFYTNHDMARSAGYYAGEDGMAKNKMAGALNLLMPGNAFVYYGEEIGMRGSAKDENYRAPMYWSNEANCHGPLDMDDFEMMYPPYEEQAKDPSSIYSFYQKMLKARQKYPAIARGTTVPAYHLCEEEYAVFERICDGYDNVLIIINLSPETEEITLSGLSYNTLAETILTGETDATLKDDTITLPGYSVAILTK